MMMYKQTFFLFFLVFIFTGVGLLLVLTKRPLDGVKRSEDKSVVPVRMVWKPDDRQMYELRMKSSILLAGKTLDAEVTGTLNSRVVEVGDSVFVAFQIAPVQVAMNGAPSPYLTEVYSNLTIGMFSEYGHIVEVMTSALLHQKDQQALANIIYSLQCVVPPLNERIAADRWTIEEKDANGSFEAFYSVSNGLIVKEKDFYSEYAHGGTNETSIRVVSSSIRAKVSENTSWLEELTGKEALEILVSTNLLSASDSAWSIRQILFHPDPGLAIWQDHGNVEEWLKTVAQFGKGDPFSQAHLAALEKQRFDDLRERYRDISVADMVVSLIASVEESIRTKKGHAATIPAIHALRDYFTVYPERALGIPEKIKADQLDDQVAGRTMLALELAGNPEAQQALARIYSDDEQATNQRLQALAAIADVEAPIQESVSDLNAFVDWESDRLIRDNAWLALGAISVRADDTSREQIREKLIDLLNRDEDRDVALLGLDNAGGAPIEVLTNSIVDDDPHIRAYAVKNLRHDNSRTAKELLDEVLEQDDGRQVRRNAMRVLQQYADPDADRIVRTHLLDEPDEQIKKEMIRYLGTRVSESENRQALESLLMTETNAAVTATIWKALSPSTTPKR